jgi:hypothetical protein
MADWSTTHWGVECTRIHARLLTEFPRLSLGIGVDGKTAREAPPRVTFVNVGEQEAPPRKASRPGALNVADRLVSLQVWLWAMTPLEAEMLLGRFYSRVNELWGTPAWTGNGTPGSRPTAKPFGGGTAAGAGYVVMGILRVMVFDTVLATAQATGEGVDIAMARSDGSGAEAAEIPDAAP